MSEMDSLRNFQILFTEIFYLIQMRSSAILVLFLLYAALAFDPVPNFNVSKLLGDWNISTLYDFSGHRTEMYCGRMNFKKLNSSIMQLIYEEFSGFFYEWSNSTINLKITRDPAVFIYANIPFTISYYASHGSGEVAILATNWTADYYKAQFFVYALTRNTDTLVDLRDFAMSYGLPSVFTRTYYYLNNGCYYTGVGKVSGYSTSSLIQNWNLLAAYDTMGYFPWNNITKSHMLIQKASNHYYNLTIFGNNNSTNQAFRYGNLVLPEPTKDGVLWGFPLGNPTSLVVNYVFDKNNIILIAGDQTFAVFLSTNQNTMSSTQLNTFKQQLSQLKNYNSKALYVLSN